MIKSPLDSLNLSKAYRVYIFTGLYTRMLEIINMIKTVFCGILFHLIFINSGISQNRNILECMELIDFDFYQYVQADLSIENCDTIIDLKSGYFELFNDETKTKFCQIAKFNNIDSTILVGITGFHADMQCSNHPSHFFEISKSGDSITPIENKAVLPYLDYPMFFTDSMSIQLLEKYLPEVKTKYLGSNGTIEDFMREIYDFHIIIPRKGTKTKLTLTVCDYKPLNEIKIGKDDWSIIEDSIRVIELIYDKDQKQFKLFLIE